MSNNGLKNGDFTVIVDLSNTTLRQTTICEKPNPNYVPPNDSNLLLFTLQKTPHFNNRIEDTVATQPPRLTMVSMKNTIDTRQIIPNIILGYIVTVGDVNVFYEVLYSENYGTRSVTTLIQNKGKVTAVDMKKSFLIVYLDVNKKIQLVGNAYLAQLLSSIENIMISNLNIKLGAYFTNKAEYIETFYSLIAWKKNMGGASNLLVHLNPVGHPMEPTSHPFTKMKTSLITIKKENATNQVYCIRNVHPPDTVKQMREYVNSPEFRALYTNKSGASDISRLLNEVKSGDITQEYDRFIFFFMKEIHLMINFKNWIRTLANEIGVDAYISFVQGSGLNVQINVMENHSNKNMNLGVHSDYDITGDALYPENTSDRRRTARTILTYVDLYARGKPVIGFTTKITSMSQNESQDNLIEYGLKERCLNLIRLTNYKNRIEVITNETENSIKTVLRPYYKQDKFQPEFIPRSGGERAIRNYFTMIDSILLPDIDDTFYYFGTQRDELKRVTDNYREILDQINTIFKNTVDSNPDITNWSTYSIGSEINVITRAAVFNNKKEYCKEVINTLKKDFKKGPNLQNNLHRVYEKSVIDQLYNLFIEGDSLEESRKKLQFSELVSDVDAFVSTYFKEPIGPEPTPDNYHAEIVKFIKDNLKELFNTDSYQRVLIGNSCPFVDGGMVYFNGQNTHTLDAGVGKRISIVYKVSFVDRDPDNKLSIEEREEIYFKKFQDDLPLANPTKTYNNTLRRSRGLNPQIHAQPISINNAKTMLRSLPPTGGRSRRTHKQKNRRRTRKI
jgi:hypothetical protein